MASRTWKADMKHSLSIRSIAFFTLFGVMMFAAKMAMAQLPNIEPVSLLVMLLAVCCGFPGLYAVYLYIACEFLIWGVGLWSVCYLYIFLMLFALAVLFQNVQSPLFWAALSGGFGLLFGLFCAPVYWVAGGWAAAVSWWIAGIPMDLIHAAGNFLIALTLFRPLRRHLLRLNRRYGIF